MYSIKKKYHGMKREELEKALAHVDRTIVTASINRRDDPKSHAVIARGRYERAVIRTELQMLHQPSYGTHS